jgi:hypothetical protein
LLLEQKETFTISGTLTEELTKAYKLMNLFSDRNNKPLQSPVVVDICNKGVKCPVPPGTPFTTKVVGH